jgi:hypothetical protein
MSDERIRELERAYRDSGDEADGWAWAEARLRSEVSFMDLVKRIIMLEERQLLSGTMPTVAEPSPQNVCDWLSEINPPPVVLCEEHELPQPCKSCTYNDRVDDCTTVTYLFVKNPAPGLEADVRRVFQTDDVRVYERKSGWGLAGQTKHIGQGGYVSRFPEGLVVALLLSSEAWSAFRLAQSMERPVCATLEAWGRHLTLAADPAGRVGAPLLTGPQLRKLVPSWKA